MAVKKQETAAAIKARKEKAAIVAAKAKMAAGRAAKQSAGKLSGFVGFVREKGVVGLAIGLALGTAATGVVSQIVGALITPTIVLLLGANGLSSLNTTVEFWGRSATYAFGDLIDALLKFLAIAAVIYFVVLGLKLDKLDKKKE